jgi:hypothetical protein
VRKSDKKPGDKSDSPAKKIIVGVIVALVAGSSSPWWWAVLFPKPTVKAITAECSPEVLRNNLFRAASDKSAIIKSTARTMKEKFSLQEFECVSGLATVLLEQDQENGHGLYFKGETWRVKAKQDPKHSDLPRERMREYFFRYMANEPHLPLDQRDGIAKACYERENGYCAERTAWINHLMAIDYFQQAEDSIDKGTKRKRLESAEKFLKRDLQFGDFDQIIPSAVLRDKIEQELQRLGAPYPADA